MVSFFHLSKLCFSGLCLNVLALFLPLVLHQMSVFFVFALSAGVSNAGFVRVSSRVLFILCSSMVCLFDTPVFARCFVCWVGNLCPFLSPPLLPYSGSGLSPSVSVSPLCRDFCFSGFRRFACLLVLLDAFPPPFMPGPLLCLEIPCMASSLRILFR